MNRLTNQALAAACAIALLFGSASAALADRGGNGHGNSGHGNGHANAHASAHANTAVHGNSASHSRNANRDNDNDNDSNESRHHGNSATAHNCVNPAGNMRGWCKQHGAGDFVTGTVTSINGNTATVALANGQTVSVNSNGLSVGERITLRGSFQNGVFVPSGRPLTNFGGPFAGASVSGTIVSINGNSLQLLRGLSLITVDISNAAARGAINGTLLPGRSITASGNWSGSTFIATSIQ